GEPGQHPTRRRARISVREQLDRERLAEEFEDGPEHRLRRGVDDVANPRAEAAERAPEHGGAGRAIGLRQPGPEREPRRDQNPARSPERPRRAARPARTEEARHAAPPRIEDQELIDRIDGAPHGDGYGITN